jgi:hypothetical protein
VVAEVPILAVAIRNGWYIIERAESLEVGQLALILRLW